MSIWPDWIKAIQLKPRYLLGVWLLGCLMLFIPSALAIALKIDNFRNIYGHWIGLAILASFCFWLVQIYPVIISWKSERAKRKNILDSIRHLPLEEKIVFVLALKKNEQVFNAPMSNKNIYPLHKRGMIEAIGSWDECYERGPCKIKKFIWRYIKKHKDEILTEDIKKQLND